MTEEVEIDDAADLRALAERLEAGQPVRAVRHEIWEDPAALLALLYRLRPPSLRELVFGQCNPRHEPGEGEIILGDLSGLWVHQGLERLGVRGKVDSFGRIDAPRLRAFDWVTITADAETLAAIAHAHWPELESLSLCIGAASDDYPAETEAMRHILDGSGLPRLRHLGLEGGALTEGLRQVLPTCGILPQLRSLDASGCYRTDRERHAFARLKRHPAFQHLEKFEV